MNRALIKRGKDTIELKMVTEGRWVGSAIAEVFESGGDTRMACGIHDIPASETIAENPPVDDILYILEGNIEISCADITETFETGDFVYLKAEVPRKFVVDKHARLLYITYPSNWANQTNQ